MFKLIYHFLVPHKGNNYRSRIIHNSSLLALIVIILFLSWVSIIVSKTNKQVLGISYSMSEQELLNLVNKERLEKRVAPLKINKKLEMAASKKAEHMFLNNYWAHFAPDSTTPWTFIIESEYDYIYAGENLAKGFVNAKDIVDAWMNSAAHRDNILSAQYEDIGFAIVEGSLEGEDTVLVVEMFGKEKNKFLAGQEPKDTKIAAVSSVAEPDKGEKVLEETFLGVSQIDNPNRGSTALYQAKPLVDIFTSTKTFSFTVLSLLLLAFVLDFAVVTRKKIPRMVGNNLDHIILISIFIVFVYVYSVGAIL